MDTKGKELKVGILFSLTGPTSITERGQCQASLLAIRQINEQGGIHGKRLVPIVEDIASDPYLAAQKAEKLILSDQVIAIIGLYTSACRKMVIPVLEKYDRLLFLSNPIRRSGTTPEHLLLRSTSQSTAASLHPLDYHPLGQNVLFNRFGLYIPKGNQPVYQKLGPKLWRHHIG